MNDHARILLLCGEATPHRPVTGNLMRMVFKGTDKNAGLSRHFHPVAVVDTLVIIVTKLPPVKTPDRAVMVRGVWGHADERRFREAAG